MHIRCVAILLLSLPAAAIASDSLCQPTEVAYFSCHTTSGKQIALCGSPLKREAKDTEQFRHGNGYLQYRFGTKQRIEKLYPEDKRASLEKFTGGYFLPAGAASASLSFLAGGYTYSVGIAGGVGVEAFSGVMVSRGFNTVARLSCINEPVLETRHGLGFVELTQLLGK